MVTSLLRVTFQFVYFLIEICSVSSPTSQLFLQPFRLFTYVIAHSPTLPLLHLRHSSFTNPYFALPTSQALQLRHLASRPCIGTPTMRHYRLFPEKSLKLEKYFPNVAPKLTDQSCSNSPYRVLLQIFLAHAFAFDLPLKLRVVHIIFFS